MSSTSPNGHGLVYVWVWGRDRARLGETDRSTDRPRPAEKEKDSHTDRQRETGRQTHTQTDLEKNAHTITLSRAPIPNLHTHRPTTHIFEGQLAQDENSVLGHVALLFARGLREHGIFRWVHQVRWYFLHDVDFWEFFPGSCSDSSLLVYTRPTWNGIFCRNSPNPITLPAVDWFLNFFWPGHVALWHPPVPSRNIARCKNEIFYVQKIP